MQEGVIMEEILRKIAQADGEAVDTLLTAVLARYGELYPDWEVCTMSVRKDEDKAKQIDAIIRRLEYMKTMKT